MVSDGHFGRVPLVLTWIPGGNVIGGGGPGGRMPSGKSNSQPPMFVSSQLRQRSKNHRLHGISVPPSVGFGSETEVVIGMMTSVCAVVVCEGGSALVCSSVEVFPSLELVEVVCSSSSPLVVVVSEVMTIEDPLLLVTSCEVGVQVTKRPLENVTGLAVVTPVGSVIASEFAESMVASPLVVVMVNSGIQVTMLPSGKVTILLLVMPVGSVTAPDVPEMMVVPSLAVVMIVDVEGGSGTGSEETTVLIELSERETTLVASSEDTTVLIKPSERATTVVGSSVSDGATVLIEPSESVKTLVAPWEPEDTTVLMEPSDRVTVFIDSSGAGTTIVLTEPSSKVVMVVPTVVGGSEAPCEVLVVLVLAAPLEESGG